MFSKRHTEKRVATAWRQGREVTGFLRPFWGRRGLEQSGEKSWVSAEWWGPQKGESSSWINTAGRSWVGLTVTSLLTTAGVPRSAVNWSESHPWFLEGTHQGTQDRKCNSGRRPGRSRCPAMAGKGPLPGRGASCYVRAFRSVSARHSLTRARAWMMPGMGVGK